MSSRRAIAPRLYADVALLAASLVWGLAVYFQTLFAALGGYFLLGDRLTLVGWAGAALILLGALSISLGPVPLAALRRRAAARTGAESG
jgi:drug/metabolite transporter (DMT)-like permease